MNNTWYLVRSKNAPLVPDQVLQAVEPNCVLTDNGGRVPIELMLKWGYSLTLVRLVEVAAGKDLLWTDKRIGEEAYNEFHVYADHENKDGVMVKLRCTPTIFCAELMRRVRDEYEEERKNKIFLPAQHRKILTKTVQSSRNFLADLIARLENTLAALGGDVEIPSASSEVAGWRAEVAAYDAILAVLAPATEMRELEQHWPSLESVPEGNDPFPQLPISGKIDYDA